MPEPHGTAKAKPYCLFAHGWAYTLDFFTPLLESLNNDHPALMQGLQVFGLEQGYFQRPAGVYQWTHFAWTPSELPSQFPPCLGVGHSLGLAKLLAPQLAPQLACTQWLSLHGFTRFTALERGQTGTPRRLVERMLSKLEHTPEAVLHDFWARAEEGEALLHPHRPSVDHANLNKLREDLHSMIELDLSKVLEGFPSHRLLAVFSPEDQIVSAELSAETFPGSCMHEVNAPHSGPLIRPKVYTHTVARALNDALGASASHTHSSQSDIRR